MKSYPLKALTVEEAKHLQFALVDAATRHLKGEEFLQLGDLGLNGACGRPKQTALVENILADFFQAEEAVLVRGAGTAALRLALASTLDEERLVLVHTAEIYPTTQTSLTLMNCQVHRANFNNTDELKEKLQNNRYNCVLVQHSRQSLEDCYDMAEIIMLIKHYNQTVITDDNYAVLKTSAIGSQLGADLSCFSLFKLLGPEGLGLVVGKKTLTSKIKEQNYSGGGQVQGFEAMEALRSLMMAPVLLAVQAEVVDELCRILNEGLYSFVQEAVIANAQSRVVLVTFKEPIAAALLKEAPAFGALPYPVGAESRYEVAPLFYRLSKTMRTENTGLTENTIRINPNRAGVSTVLSILKKAYQKVKGS